MTRSIRSRAERYAHATHWSRAGERGAATAEFAMVSSLLVVLTFAIMQLTLLVHVRNTLIDAASTGARFGVLEDRTAQDGVARTKALIDSSLSSRYAEGVHYRYETQVEGQVLTITVRAQVPVLGLVPGVGQLEVTGGAYEFE